MTNAGTAFHPRPSSATAPGPDRSVGAMPASPPDCARHPMPDWRPFAEAMLSALEGTGWAGWRMAAPAPRDADAPPDAGAAMPRQGSGATRPADAVRTADVFDGVDHLIDRLEAEAEFDLFMPQPPVAAPPVPGTDWRPKTATLLAAIRIAATFGNPGAMAAALGTRGALCLLATGNAALDQTVLKVLELVVTGTRMWPRHRPAPKVLQAADAVKTGSPDRHRPLGALSDRARDAVERGMPLVLITPVAGTAPRALRGLHPQVIPLAPLDRAMLVTLLERTYPGQRAGDALAALPAAARVSRLDPDRATLALRATDPQRAVQAIAAALCPPPAEGAGWAAFPLPAAVRAPLDQMITDLRDWQEGRIAWRDVARGPLLVGPPGSGKTQIARLIAQEAGIAVVAGSVAQWSAESPRSGDMIRAMRAAFDAAAEQAPSLLFIDEIDGFGDRARKADHNSAYTDLIVTALIDLLDGYHDHEGVMVMAATNHLAKLDRAITRAGRFDRVLTLPHPDLTLMPQAIRWHLGGALPEADLSGVAQAALGMSGADIAAAVRAARGRARQARRELALEDLSAAVAQTRPPLPESLRRIVAVHEAGHAIVGAATGRSRASLLAIGSDGGFTAASLIRNEEDRAMIEAHLATLLAGRAAERLILGRVSAGAGGDPTSDLAAATRLATALEASWGLGSSLIWQGPADGIEERLNDDLELRARVEGHLRAAEARAMRILTAQRQQLEAMAGALATAGVLSGPNLAALIGQVSTEAGVNPDVAPDPVPGAAPAGGPGAAPSGQHPERTDAPGGRLPATPLPKGASPKIDQTAPHPAGVGVR